MQLRIQAAIHGGLHLRNEVHWQRFQVLIEVLDPLCGPLDGEALLEVPQLSIQHPFGTRVASEHNETEYHRISNEHE